jgi:hypothetical protein
VDGHRESVIDSYQIRPDLYRYEFRYHYLLFLFDINTNTVEY